jgi:two-component system sensor histidine kinase EvgS
LRSLLVKISLFFIFLVLLSGPLSAQPQNASFSRTILVGCETDYPPFCIVNDDNSVTGFSVELFKAAAKAMRLEPVFVTGTWKDVKKKLELGEIDALPLVGRTPEREESFDFTIPYMTLLGAIVVRDDEYGISSLHNLIGKEVAVMKNDNAEEFLLRNNLNIKLVTYTTFSEALKQLSAGKHDAVVLQKFVAQKLISANNLKNLKFASDSVSGFHQDFCFAVKEEDKKLLALLNEGLSRVFANGTHDYLHAKWFADLELPSDNHILVGGDSNFPPFEFINEHNEPDGYNIDLVKAVASATGLQVEFRLAPWPETVKNLKSKKIDIIQGMLYSPERARHFSFSVPHSVSHYVTVTRKGKLQPPETLQELGELKLVAQKEDLMHEWAIKKGLGNNLTVVDNQLLALKGVIAGKFDCALVSRLTAFYWIKKHDFKNLAIAEEPLISPEYCLVALPYQKGLLAKFNEGLRLIEESGEYQKIRNKWFGIETSGYQKYGKILKYLYLIIVLLIVVALIGLIWSRSLKRQVAVKTRELQQSQEQYRSLIDGAPYAIYVQTEGRFAYLNHKANLLLNPDLKHSLVGKEVLDFFSPEKHIEISNRIFELNYEKRSAEPMMNTIVRPDNTTVPVEISAVPIRFAGKDGSLVFLRDLSRQIELESQLRQSSKMEAVGSLAGGIAHDFNNMLSVILGYTELLLARVEPHSELKDELQEIYSAAQRSTQITGQLLTFARKQKITLEVVNINENIEGMLKMLRRLLGESIELEWKPGKNLWNIEMDPAQVDQIIANLCVNARDAIKGHGKIVIETHNISIEQTDERNSIKPGDYIKITVKDDGCGIPKEVKNRIFDPFFTTKTMGRGTGLGLATVQDIIFQNKGIIKVESEEGQGAKFTILLPRFLAEKAKNEEKGIFKNSLKGNRQTILLVEDDEAILRLTLKILEGLNYRVLSANLPEKAIEIASEPGQKIDLLLTDVIMPKMNGKQLYHEISLRLPAIKVIFISGYTSDIIEDHAILNEKVNFLEKPFTVKDLSAKIREVLSA